MIINLTQHPATAEQREAGVIDLTGDALASLKRALTFDAIPDRREVEARAEYVAELAIHNGLGGDGMDDPYPDAAMIGGAPFFMSALESALMDCGIPPVYAFTRREAVEEVQADGSVRKVAVFKHAGFVRIFEED